MSSCHLFWRHDTKSKSLGLSSIENQLRVLLHEMLLGIYLSWDMCNHKTPTRVDVCMVNMSLIVYMHMIVASCICGRLQDQKRRVSGRCSRHWQREIWKTMRVIWCRDHLLGINFQNQLCAPCYILKYLSNLSMQSFPMFLDRFLEINK